MSSNMERLADAAEAIVKNVMASGEAQGNRNNTGALQIEMVSILSQFDSTLAGNVAQRFRIDADHIADTLRRHAQPLTRDSVARIIVAFRARPSSPSPSPSASPNHAFLCRGLRRRHHFLWVDPLKPNAMMELKRMEIVLTQQGLRSDFVFAYVQVRSQILVSALSLLGFTRFNVHDDAQGAMDVHISAWVRGLSLCFMAFFFSEKKLAFELFSLPQPSAKTRPSPSAKDNDEQEDDDGDSLSIFWKTCEASIRLVLGMVDDVVACDRDPDHVFGLLDMYQELRNLITAVHAEDMKLLFAGLEWVLQDLEQALAKIRDAANSAFCELRYAIHRQQTITTSAAAGVPGGAVHPLCRFVMNYLSLCCEYEGALVQVLTNEDENNKGSSSSSSSSVVSKHLQEATEELRYVVDATSELYEKAALKQLFLLNNHHYVVNKIKTTELRLHFEDAVVRRWSAQVQQHATQYQRQAWAGVVMHLASGSSSNGSGSGSGGVKSMVKKRLKSFNAALHDALQRHSLWAVHDTQLREELRISVCEKVVPAYRSFLSRFRHIVELHHRRSANYIKYSEEDVENSLMSLFESLPNVHNHAHANTPSSVRRRR